MISIHRALAAFSIGNPRAWAKVGSGLIHRTYRVETEQGVFVLQALHEIISDAAVEDMRVVTEHVIKHGIRVPQLELSKQGTCVATVDGNRWRMYRWINGVVHEQVKTPHTAHEAGRIVSALHRAMSTLDYIPRGSIPHFHDTAYVLNELKQVLHELPIEASEAGKRVTELLIAALAQSENKTKQLIHGDLKISNILFDDHNRAIGVIDFDTVLLHYKEMDVGDALRSWCNRVPEDDLRSTFNVELAMAAIRGYDEQGGTHSREKYFKATRLLALELSARFLIDTVRDDYFGWDASRYPSRQVHNSVRARAQLNLALSIPL